MSAWGPTVVVMGKVYDLDSEQAALLLGVVPDTVRRWARLGVVPARRNISGKWMFSADDLNIVPVRVVVEP